MIQIIADPQLPAEAPGNSLVIQTAIVAPQNLIDEAKIGVDIIINDGQPATENSEEVPATQLYFMLSMAETADLIDELVGARDEALVSRAAILEQALAFTRAQLACAKGQIGSLEVVKIADSERSGIGFGIYDLIYRDDSGDDTVIEHIQNIECYVPFIEEEQYEWLRTLVGGVHQHTTTIKIQLTGLNLEEIRTGVMNGLRNALEAQRA